MYHYDAVSKLVNHPAARNLFLVAPQELNLPPRFEQIRALLPQPIWDGHSSALDCYWKCWELAFAHLHPATEDNGFAGPFIDTCFNGHLFLWDSVFALNFARYGRRAFDFQQTLDSFYRKQHQDGFICRELTQDTGEDCFHRFDPCSTGPNLFAWSEWDHWLAIGDTNRLRRVYPVLLAYHQWLKLYRSWPDGSYWYTGWASGVDNQKRHEVTWLDRRSRQEETDSRWFLNGHLSWVEACCHQLLSAQTLLKIAEVTGESEGIEFLQEEAERLSRYIDEELWSPSSQFFHDRQADGTLSPLKSVVAFWVLLTGVVRPERLDAFVSHLGNPSEFETPHRVPAISRDDPSTPMATIGTEGCGRQQTTWCYAGWRLLEKGI